MRMRRGSKSPTTDVNATTSSRSVRSSSNFVPSGLQRLDPGPGYDEDAALQAALEASAREHAAHAGHSAGPTSFRTGAQDPLHDEDRQLQQALERSKQSSDEQFAYELQQQELEQARKAGVSAQPSSSHQADPFAILGGLSNTAPSPHAPQQPQPQRQPPRPTNNPFAPDRRMPWDIRPQSQAAPGGASAPNQDPFASLPPLYAPPSMPAQQPAQPTLSPSRPQQPYLPPGISQPQRQHQQPQQGSGWQAGYPDPWANGLPSNRPSPVQAPQPSTTDDEALARALQRQLDMEEPPRPRADTRDEALAKALQEQLNREAQPNASNTNYRPDTSGLPAGVPPAQHQGLDPNLCGGCGRPAHCGWGTYVTALGRTWHTGCFVCGHCQQPVTGQFVSQPDGARVPYHSECYRLKFGQRCCVCADIIPEVPGRGVVYMTHDFWKDQKSCPAHQEDGTQRCTACQRLCPRDEQWAQLEEGRHLCLGCLDTIVVDTQDAQPLYAKIMEFFEGMGMKLPVKPPLMLVDATALKSAEEHEAQPTGGPGGRGGRRGGGPVFHTRGLTLTQEYRQMRTIRSVPKRGSNGGLLPFFIRPETTHIEGPTHTEVTAILVQYGLPWLLTGSILAHELMHAWLRLAGLTQLSLDVEEGLCQLMALLWLEHQPPAPEGTWEERLASYFAHQIRTDTSLVYGDGFRAAHEAFQKHGLGATLASVRANGCLPID